jgi:hypothetical protein
MPNYTDNSIIDQVPNLIKKWKIQECESRTIEFYSQL